MDTLRQIDFSSEWTFQTARSSGAGGQHVNKTETKVSLYFDVVNSTLLTADQKALLRDKLATRISKKGILKITSQKERSQVRNKQLVIEKFYNLIVAALQPEKKRKPTSMPKSVKKKIRKKKTEQSQKKKDRQTPWQKFLE